MLCDRGGQFVDPTGVGTTHFEEILKALEIKLRIAARTQTKGKEERTNQFIQRDFLKVRWQVISLTDLNRWAEAWRQRYNHTHVNESTRYASIEQYKEGQVDLHFLRQLFAREERRKVTREATICYHNMKFWL